MPTTTVRAVADSRIAGSGMTSQRARDRLAQQLAARGIEDSRVLDVIASTPRHLFVDEALSAHAYLDKSLPIGHRQTISQPYVVARMTEALLADGPLDKVLEIGTGSGYQAAVLAPLAKTIFTVERIRALHELARSRFRDLRLRNVRALYSDGNDGWSRYAPFDGVIVTAGHEQVPETLLEQLALGGRLIMPLGPENAQQLVMFRRQSNGYEQIVLEPVKFVPLLAGRQ